MNNIKLYWSRVPGKFVNKLTGEPIINSGMSPSFTGSTREWYETLVETIIDASNQFGHWKMGEYSELLIAGKDTHIILIASILYKLNHDITSNVATLTKRFKVYEGDIPNNEVHLKHGWDDEHHAIVTVLDMSTIIKL